MVVVVGEVFKIYAVDRIKQRFVEQITLTIRFRVLEVFTVHAQDKFSSASSSHSPGAVDEAFTGFFTLSQNKKVRGCPHLGSEVAADSSPSTRRAYGVSMAVEEDESEPATESELDDEGELNAWIDDSGDSWVLVH